jgi:hypothetical protein
MKLERFCGVGGNRTLVQTGSKNDFYMLSFCWIVGSGLVKSQPIRTVFPEISFRQWESNGTSSTFLMPRP